MDTFNTFQLLAELDREHCHLNHGPGVDNTAFSAVDYIVIPIGHQEDEVTDIVTRELVIPVCAECARALLGDEWTLLYCFECNRNHWVNREFAKNAYRHHVLWLKGCPDCTGKFGGLYFSDMPAMEQVVPGVGVHLATAMRVL